MQPAVCRQGICACLGVATLQPVSVLTETKFLVVMALMPPHIQDLTALHSRPSPQSRYSNLLVTHQCWMLMAINLPSQQAPTTANTPSMSD